MATVILLALGLLVSCERHAAPPDVRQAGVPSPIPYPPEWQTTLAVAERTVAFKVLVPADPLANEQAITSVYVYPGGQAVALDFPPPAEPQEPIRQAYIEVWESAWQGGDPKADFDEEIAKDPAVGKKVIDIAGVPAIVVEAHSPSDAEQANPAFVRFVLGNVDVQISGGEDLQALIRIAESIVKVGSTSVS